MIKSTALQSHKRYTEKSYRHVTVRRHNHVNTKGNGNFYQFEFSRQIVPPPARPMMIEKTTTSKRKQTEGKKIAKMEKNRENVVKM